MYIAFNAFPDYEDTSGWEGSLRSISKFMCCGKVLERTEVQGRCASASVVCWAATGPACLSKASPGHVLMHLRSIVC